MRLLIILSLVNIFVSSTSNAQCPEGPAPSFWHPDQVDSFKSIYPNCEDYTWAFYYENGEVIKKPEPSNVKYLFVLFGFYVGIILILKLIISKVKYFQ